MAGRSPQQAIDAKTQARVAELVGLGLSQREAAGACGISEKSVERILRKPEYKKLADDTRARRTSVTAQAAGVVHDLLAAVDDHGNPHMGLRKMGAELVMKNPALLEQVEQVEGDEPLLPGVVLRFPWAVKYSRDSGEPETAEQGSARSHESENGSADDLESPSGESPNLREPQVVEGAVHLTLSEDDLLRVFAPQPTAGDDLPCLTIHGEQQCTLPAEHAEPHRFHEPEPEPELEEELRQAFTAPITEPIEPAPVIASPAPPPPPAIAPPDDDAPLFTLEDMQ